MIDLASFGLPMGVIRCGNAVSKAGIATGLDAN
jgi:hypothetical protein